VVVLPKGGERFDLATQGLASGSHTVTARGLTTMPMKIG
jgi:hypothetical protein